MKNDLTHNNLYAPPPRIETQLSKDALIFIEELMNSPGDSISTIGKRIFKGAKNPASKALSLNKNTKVKAEISRRRKLLNYQVDYSAKDVIDRLWIEATRQGEGSQHSSRIKALLELGKYIGMWEDKSKEDSGIVINVVNYEEAKIVKALDNEKVLPRDIPLLIKDYEEEK